MTEPPRADWLGAWSELRGYIELAATDGRPLYASHLLYVMDSIKRDTLRPVVDWLKR